ncbi:CehA/McbA family metallohydrolase [Mesorhizobium sp. M0730]
MTFNPRDAQISAFGLADWYRYLNIGYHMPLVAGSDKMNAASLLGGVRTYAYLGYRDFTFQNWMEAVRGGDTFITVGPLVSMAVEEQRPGAKIRLPRGGGKVAIDWQIESVSVPPKRVELLRNGRVVDEFCSDKLSCRGHSSLQITESCWLAVRVRGSVARRDADIAAHTSAVLVEVGDSPLFVTSDAVGVLAQIEGSIAYLDTLAPISDEARQARMRATLALAHHRLHHRLHQFGASHEHSPVHSIHTQREHKRGNCRTDLTRGCLLRSAWAGVKNRARWGAPLCLTAFVRLYVMPILPSELAIERLPPGTKPGVSESFGTRSRFPLAAVLAACASTFLAYLRVRRPRLFPPHWRHTEANACIMPISCLGGGYSPQTADWLLLDWVDDTSYQIGETEKERSRSAHGRQSVLQGRCRRQARTGSRLSV